MSLTLDRISSMIFNHLPPKYSKRGGSLFRGLIEALSVGISKVMENHQAVPGNLLVQTAHGARKIGKRADIRKLSGLFVRFIDEYWIDSESVSITWNPDERMIMLDGFSPVYLQESESEVNLGDESHFFWVLVDPSRMPGTLTQESIVLQDKLTPDYLGEIVQNRKQARRAGESDESLRTRALSLGLSSSKWKLVKQLRFLLGRDVELSERRERWESPCFPGISFCDYSGATEKIPNGWISERFFGSHFFERSLNTLRFQVDLTGIPSDVDPDIHDVLSRFKTLQVKPELERVA